MNKRINLFFIFLILMLVNSVYADKVTVSTAYGLEVNTWEVGTIKQGQSYNFVWDILSETGLVNNTNSNCTFFLHKAGTTKVLVGGSTGIPSTPPGDRWSWYKNVGGGNFTELGFYDYQIDCFLLSNMSIAGSAVSSFEVTPTGFPANNNFFWIVLLISTGIIIGGFMIKDPWVTILGTFGFYFLGLYTILYGIVGVKDMVTTWAIGIITIGIAAYISIFSAIEVVETNM